jgi:hypothetical protein
MSRPVRPDVRDVILEESARGRRRVDVAERRKRERAKALILRMLKDPETTEDELLDAISDALGREPDTPEVLAALNSCRGLVRGGFQ